MHVGFFLREDCPTQLGSTWVWLGCIGYRARLGGRGEVDVPSNQDGDPLGGSIAGWGGVNEVVVVGVGVYLHGE